MAFQSFFFHLIFQVCRFSDLFPASRGGNIGDFPFLFLRSGIRSFAELKSGTTPIFRLLAGIGINHIWDHPFFERIKKPPCEAEQISFTRGNASDIRVYLSCGLDRIWEKVNWLVFFRDIYWKWICYFFNGSHLFYRHLSHRPDHRQVPNRSGSLERGLYARSRQLIWPNSRRPFSSCTGIIPPPGEPHFAEVSLFNPPHVRALIPTDMGSVGVRCIARPYQRRHGALTRGRPFGGER